jgi:hypothetical protein
MDADAGINRAAESLSKASLHRIEKLRVGRIGSEVAGGDAT